MTSAQQPLPCPHCGATLDLSLPACASCGLQLRGPRAVRLWQVDQQLASLTDERRALVDELLAPSVPTPFEPHLFAPRRSSPTGQQVLLGLGALLTLSAAAFLGVVVWRIAGVWGQAFLLCVMIALSVAGTAVATRRRLPAAAETGAVLASGLTAVGAWAAWSLNLAGLGGVSFALYAALAGLVVGGLVLGYDRLAPGHSREGEPLRRILTYRPLATAALSAVPWLLLVEVAPSGVGLTIGLGLVALVAGGLWLLTRTLESGNRDDQGLVAAAPSTWPPALAAAFAAVLYVVFGLGIAHDLDTPTHGWSALLMILSAALLPVAAARVALPGPVRRWLPVAVTLIAALAAWSLTWEAHWALLVAAAVVLAAAMIALTYAPFAPGTIDSVGHRCVQLVAGAAGVGLTLELLVLRVADEPVLAGNDLGVGSGPALWFVACVPTVWAVAGLVVAIRLRSVLWLIYAHLALTVALAIALLDSSARTQTVVWLVAGIVLAAIAAAVVTGLGSAPWGLTKWDLAPSVFAAGFAAVAAMVSVTLPHPWAAWTLIVAGVAAFAFSLLPARLPVAYLAAPVISVGVGLLASRAGWDVVEVYTWPLAVLLAMIGRLHWRRDRSVRSRISMGPALSAALLPSVLVAIGDGATMRLALATAAGVILLVAGLALRLQAPVAVAGVALACIAINQGGPHIARVDRWVTLGLAGIVLLTVGISWERAVVAGRRGSAWFSHLR